jgi:hypothetical protein
LDYKLPRISGGGADTQLIGGKGNTLRKYFFKNFREKQNYQSIGKSGRSDFIAQWLLCGLVLV